MASYAAFKFEQLCHVATAISATYTLTFLRLGAAPLWKYIVRPSSDLKRQTY